MKRYQNKSVRYRRCWARIALSSLILLGGGPDNYSYNTYYCSASTAGHHNDDDGSSSSSYSSIVTSGNGSKRIRKGGDPSSRRFRVRNLSLSTIEVFWIRMMTEERMTQFELVAGATDTLNSHMYHEFEIREKPNKKGECQGKKGKCRKRYFQIGEDEDQVFTLGRDFTIETSNSRTIAKERAKESLTACRHLEEIDFERDIAKITMNNNHLLEEQLDKLAQCMTGTVQQSLYQLQEEIDFQATIRLGMASKLKDYACGDPDFPPTKAILQKEWNPSNPRLRMDDADHTVNVLLKSDSTMVATIDNMVWPWDCQFVQEGAGQPGGPNHIPWEARKNPAFLEFLTRIYAYVDPAVRVIDMYARLPKKGEVLFEWHEDSAAPPHQTTRNYIGDWPVEEPHFARLIMFCNVPEEGGAIHFPESGVHINPQEGQGILITYTKQSTKQSYLESFRNEHVDCPILQGTQTVVQHQFRLFPRETPPSS